MIAVDTNSIVRLLTRDDDAQFQKSLDLFRTQDVFMADTVIREVEWVFRFAYKFSTIEICTALRNLFGLPNVHLNQSDRMAQVLNWHESGLDSADALHLAYSEPCLEFYTFDDRFIKRANGLTDCVIKMP